METGLRVRLATADDRAAIIAVVNAAFAVETFFEGTRTDDERLAKMMQAQEFLVGEENGRIVASVSTEERGERGYFGMLAVDPSLQGKGVGRVMVEAAEDFLRQRGCEVVDITVLSLRPELPTYYRNLGYVQTGIEEFHPSRPFKPGTECIAIVMTKEL